MPGKGTGLDPQGRFDLQLTPPADEIFGDLLGFGPAVSHLSKDRTLQVGVPALLIT